ncbi:HAMP domain-containing histidine kinase [candidate division KSB1 bacterium]|nr:HAMP domain-containing histidine kinase [candidate division KSB1 bacterium]
MTDVSGYVSMSTIRVAGAMAHELNNPLQGLVSAVAAATMELGADERIAPRLRQIEGGVQRVTRAVRSFSALYEHLPRDPDSVPLAEFTQSVCDALNGFDLRIEMAETVDARRVRCHSAELGALTAEVVWAVWDGAERARLWVEDRGAASAVCIMHPAAADAARVFRPLQENDGLSGLPVVLDEVARLAGGHLELVWSHDRIAGIALVLINECKG